MLRRLIQKICIVLKGAPHNTFDSFDLWDIKTNSTHSEMSFVIRHVKSHGLNPSEVKKEDLIKLDFPKHLVNLRLYHNGALKISKPCSDCQKLLKLCGVEKVTYSTSDPDNQFVTEDIATMVTKKSSNRCTR